MKKLVLVLGITISMLVAFAGNSWALITPNDTAVLPQVYQAINQVFVNAGLASPGLISNSEANAYQVAVDNYWKDLADGTASDFAFVGITANNSNTLGVFKIGDPLNVDYVMDSQSGYGYVGSGTAADPYFGGVNTLAEQDFGFALQTVDDWYNPPNVTTTVWYSDPTYNTIDGMDHMLSYYLPELDGAKIYINMGEELKEITLTKDTYLLAWEDLKRSSSDLDYNDSIFLVTRVSPIIPEPMTMALFGTGLVGLLGLRKKG